MIVNIEWGNFDKLKATCYDKKLDRESVNPRRQMLEKMVSGKYLGRICRLIIEEFARNKLLFGDRTLPASKVGASFTGEELSDILGDNSKRLSAVKKILDRSGFIRSKLGDRIMVKKICGIVTLRAARISAAAMVAVATRMDPGLYAKHIIAIDGSIYEKLPRFSDNVKEVVSRLCGKKRGKINIKLTKDGSTLGAAIVAAEVSNLSTKDISCAIDHV